MNIEKNQKPENNKILVFPKDKIVRNPLLNTEEALCMKENKKQIYASQLTGDITEDIILTLAGLGMDVTSKEFMKDSGYLSEIMYATICRMLEVHHPLQDFMDNNIEIVPPDVMEKIKEALEAIEEPETIEDDETKDE